MRKIYSAFRIFVHIVIFSIIAIYTLGYILLSIPNIQDKVRHIGIKELSALLDTNITIDRIQISPFNKLELFGAYIPDLNGDTLLYANKISAGISLSDLLVDRELVFTNIQLQKRLQALKQTCNLLSTLSKAIRIHRKRK